MYTGIHRIDNTNAEFIMSRPVRSTYFWSMGRERKHLREESNQSNERIESSITGKSDKPNDNRSTICPRSADTSCPVSNYCSNGECPKCQCYNCDCNTDGKLPNNHGDSCSCPSCRDYNDYTEYTATVTDPQRERSSTGIWIGNELRTTKCTDTDATDTIEYITGIQSGVTI